MYQTRGLAKVIQNVGVVYYKNLQTFPVHGPFWEGSPTLSHWKERPYVPSGSKHSVNTDWIKDRHLTQYVVVK